jgi:hypothetical protein
MLTLSDYRNLKKRNDVIFYQLGGKSNGSLLTPDLAEEVM